MIGERKDAEKLKGKSGIYILAIPPPGKILSKVKNREEFEGRLEKRKGKGGKRRKKEKSAKTHVKIPL